MPPAKAGHLWQSRSWLTQFPRLLQAAWPTTPKGARPGSAAAVAAAAKRRLTKNTFFFLGLFLLPLYFMSGCWKPDAKCGFGFSGVFTSPGFKRITVGEIPNFDVTPRNYSDPFAQPLPEVLMTQLKQPWRGNAQLVPVVQIYQRGGSLSCQRRHFIARSLMQARRHNRVVYLIGPEECAELASDLDIKLEPFSEYRDVVEWFRDKIGFPVAHQVRWFILRKFMEKHAFPRVFHMDPDVLLFANITDVSNMLYRRQPLLLNVRWPSLRSVGPSQYATIAVSGHVSIWTYDALCDFLSFFQLFFQEAVLFGAPGDKTLTTLRPYNDMTVLGWYTFKICWTKPPESLHPQCVADVASGVNPERSARIRGKFTPKFRVESLNAPRWCNRTDYVDKGWCVFDYDFSVQSPRAFFKYRPNEGMKVPTSMHYTHFEDWSKDQMQQTLPVRFLAVHFQAHKRGYLERGDNPEETWGSNDD